MFWPPPLKISHFFIQNLVVNLKGSCFWALLSGLHCVTHCLICTCDSEHMNEWVNEWMKNCCCITASITTSRMNSWTLSLHWSCLCWRCCHPCLISSKQTVSSSRYLFYSIGLKSYPGPRQNCKTWVQVTIFIDHGSHAVLPTIDRLQLGWLTNDVDPGVMRFWHPENM